MAPVAAAAEASKPMPKVQRSVVTKTPMKSKPSSASTHKNNLTEKKKTKKIPLKMNTAIETRQRTSTVPKVNTPKAKEIKTLSLPPGSVKKPLWKRRPLPAHSGVPVPEKMKQLRKCDINLLDL